MKPAGAAVPTKWRRVLLALLDGRSFNRFESERALGDHCLHSTVATIQGKGVPVERKNEQVPGYMGIATDCCRYWLSEESKPKARRLLGLDEEGARTEPRPTHQAESMASGA